MVCAITNWLRPGLTSSYLAWTTQFFLWLSGTSDQGACSWFLHGSGLGKPAPYGWDYSSFKHGRGWPEAIVIDGFWPLCPARVPQGILGDTPGDPGLAHFLSCRQVCQHPRLTSGYYSSGSTLEKLYQLGSWALISKHNIPLKKSANKWEPCRLAKCWKTKDIVLTPG